jgi:hypothetical protein
MEYWKVLNRRIVQLSFLHPKIESVLNVQIMSEGKAQASLKAESRLRRDEQAISNWPGTQPFGH